MAVTSRDMLIEYCLRKLGAPVIEINVDQDQLEDRVDEALEWYVDFHSDATIRTYLKHQITDSDLTNGYIPISSEVIHVSRMFPIQSNFGSSYNMFDIKYQMMLNDVADLHNFIGDVAYYDQIQQYLSLLDMKLNGSPIVNFSRHQNRLYINGDILGEDLKVDDYVVVEVYQIINPESHTSVYNDRWLKDYTAALIKQQWGSNLIKFEGMQLPGGVTLNGRQIFEDANQEIQDLRERLRLEQELPPDFFVG
jgi:hypothetical protein